MTTNTNKKLDINLLLPAGLLILEITAVVVLLVLGYEINIFLIYFLVLLSVFLFYQIFKQWMVRRLIKQAIRKLDDADEASKSNRPTEAMKIIKEVLLSLTRENYLIALSKLEAVYEKEQMKDAVQQTIAIREKSLELFKINETVTKASPNDRRDWQARAVELRDMIDALPVEKTDTESDVNFV